MRNISPEQLLALFETLIKDAPAFPYGEARTEPEQRWLARAEAALGASGHGIALAEFRVSRNSLGTYSHSRSSLLQPLYNAFYAQEIKVPSAQQGGFIPPGDTWNGYAALVKIVQTECDQLLIVDPYIVADIFADLVPHAVAKQSVRILTAKHRERHQPLLASAQKWQATHPAPAPPVEVRYAADGALHDRLIIADDKEVWSISQSIKDIAKKSPASVSKDVTDLAQKKAQHYEGLWSASSPIA